MSGTTSGGAAPVPKVWAAGIGGAVSALVLWGVAAWTSADVPPEVGAAIATLVAFVAGYLTPPGDRP